MDNHTNNNTNTTTTATSTSAADFNPTATGGGAAAGRDQFLRSLNKLSHKISKPAVPLAAGRRLLPEPAIAPPLQQQPPVYNISKSDFRDVVQKLTGSPAHDRVRPPPAAATMTVVKPASSRLQRIRPPPLAQLSNRPPTLLNCTPTMINGFSRPTAPFSPLPPLPSCHASAESPISAYMRFLHSSISAVDSDQKFNAQPPPSFNFPTMMLPPQQQFNNPSSSSDSLSSLHFPPSSPLPFACLPSPKSPCPLLSPKPMCSPTGTGPLGFPQLPISPTVSGVPSPK